VLAYSYRGNALTGPLRCNRRLLGASLFPQFRLSGVVSQNICKCSYLPCKFSTWCRYIEKNPGKLSNSLTRLTKAADPRVFLAHVRTMHRAYETVLQFWKQQEKKYMVVASPPYKPTLFYYTTFVSPPCGPGKVWQSIIYSKEVFDIQFPIWWGYFFFCHVHSTNMLQICTKGPLRHTTRLCVLCSIGL
jgi:hypothetical protein